MWLCLEGVAANVFQRLGEDVLVGAGAGELHNEAADAHFDEGANPEELEANGAAGGLGEARCFQRDAAQGTDQHIGHGGKPQPQLIGAHRVGAGAVCEEVELLLLDPVLHIAAGTSMVGIIQ